MELSPKFQAIATSYNLKKKHVFFALLIAAGASPDEAHFAIYATSDKGTNQKHQDEATEILRLNPGLSLAIEELKKQIQPAKTITQHTEEELFSRFKTREGVISELIKAAADLNGKDAVQALQTVAKLQGFDRPEEASEDERRIFVLRWLSHCRSCKLMKIFEEEASKKGHRA